MPLTVADLTMRNAPFMAFGAAKDLMYFKGPEVLLSGAAGTGKSRACLEKLHLICEKYDGVRCLILRKTRVSITQTAQVTYEQKVLPEGHLGNRIRWRSQEQEYRYSNGSKIVIGGLDNPTRIMSTEYDVIYVNEAIELTENEWEQASTRLRNGVLPYQQMIGDTNPQAPTHWLKKRADSGVLTMMNSRHEDNPRLFNQKTGELTEEGKAYIARLDALTGVRKARLRYGQWAAAEGLVFENWDRGVHIVEKGHIPSSWPRYWSVDFGYTHPFVWQAWALDPDGRLHRYHEIYMTGRLVTDHCKEIERVTKGEPRPRAIICDHDAEDRATIARYFHMDTTPAIKAVQAGIQAVNGRLKVAGDGKPRLLFHKDSLVKADPKLLDDKSPVCAEDEFDSYVWDSAPGAALKEVPIKKYDHAMDAMRYMVAHIDGVGKVRKGFRPAGAKAPDMKGAFGSIR